MDQSENDKSKSIVESIKKNLSKRSRGLVRRGLDELSQPELFKKLLELNPYECIIISDHIGPVTCAALSHRDEQMITGEQDGSVKIWALSDLTIVSNLPRHTEEVTAASFMGNNYSTYSAGMDGVVHFHDTRSGEVFDIQHDGGITACDVSNDGSLFVVGTAHEAHEDGSPDATYLTNGLVQAWDLKPLQESGISSKPGLPLWQHKLSDVHFPSYIKISPDNRLVLFLEWVWGQEPTFLHVVNLQDGNLAMRTFGEGGALQSPRGIAFFGQANEAIMPTYFGPLVRILDTNTFSWNESIELENEKIYIMLNSMDVSENGKYLALGESEGDHIFIHDLATGKQIAALEGHSSKVTTVKFFSNMQFLLSTSLDATIRIWKLPELV